MDNFASSITSHLAREVKTEPDTEDYEVNTFSCIDVPTEKGNTLKAENLELKEFAIKNESQNGLHHASFSSDKNHAESAEIVPECNETFLNHAETLVKIEKREALDEDEQMCDVLFENRKIKIKELDMNEKDLESTKTRCSKMFSDRIETLVKNEKSEAIIESEQTCDANFADWKIKNEELHLKEEDLESTKTSNLSSQDGSKLYHKNTKKLNIFKCDQCDYQSVRKRNFKVHMLRHNPENVSMLKCNQCDYQSIRRGDLIKHIRRHNNPGVNIFKCDQCDYQTVHNCSLKRHSQRHKNPEDIKIFKCHICDYQSIYECYFKRHHLRHKNPEEVNIFKCDHCDYQSIYRSHLNTHLLRHKNPAEVTMFKCNECDYESRYRGNIKMHLRRHRNPGVPIFKCDQCDYQTVENYAFKKHSQRHKNTYKCNLCNYQSMRKSDLNTHLLRHKNPDEVNMFKCDQCDYQSMYNHNLKSHIRRHKKKKINNMIKFGQLTKDI